MRVSLRYRRSGNAVCGPTLSALPCAGPHMLCENSYLASIDHAPSVKRRSQCLDLVSKGEKLRFPVDAPVFGFPATNRRQVIERDRADRTTDTLALFVDHGEVEAHRCSIATDRIATRQGHVPFPCTIPAKMSVLRAAVQRGPA